MYTKKLSRLVRMVTLGAIALSGPRSVAGQQAPIGQAALGAFSIPYETYRLSNGLNVILARDSTLPLAAVVISYRVGTVDEDPGRSGFAHLFEHLLLQGSEHVPAEAIARVASASGGGINGTASSDRSWYWWIVGSAFVESALWVLSDQMGFSLPVLSEARLANQKEIVKNEIRQRVDIPLGRAEEPILATLYPPDHPFSRPGYGSEADLDAATLSDVHAFYSRYYVPNNATLAVMGEFDPDQIRRQIVRYFADIPAGSTVARRRVTGAQLDSAAYVVMHDKVVTPWLYITWQIPGKYSSGHAEFNVLSRLLGNGSNSRLHRRLVEEQRVAQNVAADPDEQVHGGRFTIRVQAAPEVTLDQLEDAILEEVDRVRNELVSPAEIATAAANIEVTIMRALEMRVGRASELIDYVTFADSPDSFVSYLRRNSLVTPATVQAAARRYLGGARVVLSVVPEGRSEMQAKP